MHTKMLIMILFYIDIILPWYGSCHVIQINVPIYTVPNYSQFGYKNKDSRPSGIFDHSLFWQSCLGPLVYLLRRLLNYLALKSFDYERT
jgi:hypothetical protein